MTKLRKAFALSPSDWILVAQAAAWFAVVEIGLRVLKLRTLPTIFQNHKPANRVEGDRPGVSPARVRYCVELASRFHPLHPTCLKKALVLYAMLTRRGVNARVIVGAAKSDSKLDAHAWIEHQGQVILGGPATDQYAPLCRLDGDLLC